MNIRVFSGKFPYSCPCFCPFWMGLRCPAPPGGEEGEAWAREQEMLQGWERRLATGPVGWKCAWSQPQGWHLEGEVSVLGCLWTEE